MTIQTFLEYRKFYFLKLNMLKASIYFFDQPAPSMKDNQNNKTGGTQQSTYALEKTRNLDFKQASNNEFCKGVYICIHTIFHFILLQICTYLL